MMKRSTVLLWLFVSVLLANLPYLWRQFQMSVTAQTTNPVSMAWVTPTNGQVVSGTVPLTVTAGSTAGRIARVEFYRDGQLISVVTPLAQPASNLKVLVTR